MTGAVAAFQALLAVTPDPSIAYLVRRPIMEIVRKSDLQSVEGPSDHFTGRATITGQFQRPLPSRVSGAIVRFERGARTAWHTHPAGQTLIVTDGVGWTQLEGGPKLEFAAGDILWCPADQKHWHGATPHGPMTHIAIQESVNGSPPQLLRRSSEQKPQLPLASPRQPLHEVPHYSWGIALQPANG